LERMVRVELAPPSMLGRYLQYGFVSILAERGALTAFEPGGGYFEASISDYVDAVARARALIVESLMRSRPVRGCTSESSIEGVDCCRLDSGPHLYTVGSESDQRLLQRLFQGPCRAAVRGKPRVTWVYAALNYAAMVEERGGPLCGEGCRSEPPPFLAKSSVFSVERRASGQGGESKHVKLSIDAIGTILLGGAIEYLGAIRTGDRSLEVFLTPVAPSPAFMALRGVAAYGGVERSLAAKLAGLVRELGVSLEEALLYAYALQLGEAGKQVEALQGVELSARLQLVSTSGRRPLVAEGVPLSSALARSFSPRTLARIAALPRTGGSDEARRALSKAVETCIHALAMEAQYPCMGFVSDCARTLAMVLEQAPAAVGEALQRLEKDWRSRCG